MGSLSVVYKGSGLLRLYVVTLGECFPTFRRNVVPSSSGLRMSQNTRPYSAVMVFFGDREGLKLQF